jgi:hypothetical protein
MEGQSSFSNAKGPEVRFKWDKALDAIPIPEEPQK